MARKPFYERRRWRLRQWFRRTWIGRAKSYVRNRWFDKIHIVEVRALKKGQYSDRVEILFHAVFQILVDFVERELGHEGVMSKGDREYYREQLTEGKPVHPAYIEYLETPIRQRRKDRKKWAEKFGLAVLDWYATLDGPHEEHPHTSQAQFGRDGTALYLWYKYERAKRPDPDETYVRPSPRYIKADGALTNDMIGDKTEDGNWYLGNHATPEYMEYVKKVNALEESYHDEDQAMLKRVIDLRRGMWT